MTFVTERNIRHPLIISGYLLHDSRVLEQGTLKNTDNRRVFMSRKCIIKDQERSPN